MFVLGHLGIGNRLSAPFTRARPQELRWLLFGCLLPDLVDKPLYYGLSFATGLRGGDLGLISSTRTVGHTALFALAVWLLLRRWHGAAIALGMATHLFLDALGDVAGLFLPRAAADTGPSTFAAVFFPLLGPRFPISHFHDLVEHAASFANPYVVAGEVVGAALIAWELHRRRNGRSVR